MPPAPPTRQPRDAPGGGKAAGAGPGAENHDGTSIPGAGRGAGPGPVRGVLKGSAVGPPPSELRTLTRPRPSWGGNPRPLCF